VTRDLAVTLPASSDAEAAMVANRPWAQGTCLLCRADGQVTPVVEVYQGGTTIRRGKCRTCVVDSLLLQQATAEALRRPYDPSLPP
jgi:hypothetical protein